MVDHHGYYDAYHGWVPETWYDAPHPIHPLHGKGPVPGVAHSAEPLTTVEEHVVAHHGPWEGAWHGEAWHGDAWHGDYMSDHHIWDEYHPDDPFVAKARASLEKSKQKQAPKEQAKPAAKQPAKKAPKKQTGNYDYEDNYGFEESYYTN